MAVEQSAPHFLEVGPGTDPLLGRQGVKEQFRNLFPNRDQPIIHSIDSNTKWVRPAIPETFQPADMAKLPFSDNSFDLIVIKDVLGEPHYFPIDNDEPGPIATSRKFVFFAEAKRVLVSGGRLIIIENNTPDCFLQDIDYMKNFARHLGPVELQNYFRRLTMEERIKIAEMFDYALHVCSEAYSRVRSPQDLVKLLADKNGLITTIIHGQEAVDFLTAAGANHGLMLDSPTYLGNTFVAILQKP